MNIMGPKRSGHGRLGEPRVTVNPGMAQEKRGHPLVSQYQTKPKGVASNSGSDFVTISYLIKPMV